VKAPVGVSLMPLETRREAFVRLAAGAERHGYAGFFLPESWAYDVTVLLAEAAVRTERIGLGTGILSVWGRSPGTLAMAAATLHDVSGGRFTLGLGASTAQLVEGLHDVPYRGPFDRMRRTIVQVRTLLAGERLPIGTTGARPLRLNLPPHPEVPIHLAGLASETIRLAGELADGWLPFLFPRSRLPEGIALLREGAERASPARPLPAIVPSLPTVVAADADEARRGAAWFVAFYLTSMGPFYPRTISRLGFAKEVEAVIAANPTRGSAVVPPEAEALLDELTVYGTPEQARARLASWHQAGAAMPVLLLPPNQTPAQIDFALEALC
jgi:alkanesulfonate monooxygenase SsuD/methylene tetrahydromethanopterin reductase-like flavin-dependent oxidoreductase (luciferase family)